MSVRFVKGKSKGLVCRIGFGIANQIQRISPSDLLSYHLQHEDSFSQSSSFFLLPILQNPPLLDASLAISNFNDLQPKDKPSISSISMFL